MAIIYITLSFILINGYTVSSCIASEENTSQEISQKNFYAELKGEAVYFDRDKNFNLGNSGNWGMGANGTVLELYDFDMSKWGEGYQFALGLARKDALSFEFSFEQNLAALKKVKTGITGVGAGNLSVMPFIDSNFGTLSKGFFITAAVAGGENAPGNLTLKYDLDYLSYRLSARKKFWDKNGFTADLFAGPVYSRFSQHYNVSTTGTNPWGGGGETTSGTSEGLIDNLFGAQMGLKAKKQLTQKFSLSFDGMTDLFYRRSELDATQSITNASNQDDANLNATLKVSQRTAGFVPHLSTNVNLGYDLTKNTSLNLFYQFNMWYNLTSVDNPTLTGDERTLSGSTRIRNEDMRSQVLGISMLVNF